MPIEQIFARLAESALSGSKSTALKPMLTLDCLLLLAALASRSPIAGVPNAVQQVIAWALAIALFVTISAYVYFMFKNPDALRSERYTLEKMAIEKGLVGDSGQGVLERQKLPKHPQPEVIEIRPGDGA